MLDEEKVDVDLKLCSTINWAFYFETVALSDCKWADLEFNARSNLYACLYMKAGSYSPNSQC